MNGAENQHRIAGFRGKYRFLSNFWPVEIAFEGYEYPSVEHAYQAAKTLDPAERKRILQAPTPASARRLGRTVKIRPDWDRVKLDIMRQLLAKKFSHPELRKALLATGQAELIEDNWWGDRFWGVCREAGHNHLGRLLMEIRERAQKERRSG